MSKALVIGAIGARGSGKSEWVKRQLARAAPRRLVVWDRMHEYAGVAGCEPVPDLGTLIRAMKARQWRVAYQVPANADPMHFELLCRAVYQAKKCTFLVEELAFVTTPLKAPPAWREVTLLGRHQDITVIGTSQRPASVDKDFLAGCDVLHCGRAGTPRDAQAVAPYLACEWRELLQLPDLHWIEKTPGNPLCTRGTLSFGNAPQKKSHAAKRSLRRAA